MPTSIPCSPCAAVPQVVDIPGIDGAAGAAGPNLVDVTTTTTLNGILIGNGATVGVVANPLPAANGGTGYAVAPNRYVFKFTTDPAAATSPTQVAAGLGHTGNGLGAQSVIVPGTTGTFLILLTAILKNGTAGSGATAQLYYGTGTSGPANGAVLTGGTALGSAKALVAPTGTGAQGIALAFIVTGLSASTSYWLDVALNYVTAGTAIISNIDLVAIEL